MVKNTDMVTGEALKARVTAETGSNQRQRATAPTFGKTVLSNLKNIVLGDTYVGDWWKCLKHGRGKDTFASGDSYEGEYRYGKPWGRGIYRWKNGSVYEGDFKEGMKHGKGRWQKGKGSKISTYEGGYYHDKKHGSGTFKWASGNIYKVISPRKTLRRASTKTTNATGLAK